VPRLPGQKLQLLVPESGDVISFEVFVVILSPSQLTYVKPALRYGDLRSLRKNDFGDGRIHFHVQKNKETFGRNIKLGTKALAIIEKYKHLPGNLLLQTYCNSNKLLKEVFTLAKIERIVTIVHMYAGGKTEEIILPLSKVAHSHMERKTFITTALTLGMPESVLKANTGHSKSSNSFKCYYKIIDSVKDDAMDATFGKLELILFTQINMIDHPIYNGDFISQAMNEINRFNLMLDSSLELKSDKKEFNLMPGSRMDISSFPEYSFGHFKKYTDEKLSSINPDIYISDLDEIHTAVVKCITKYSHLIGKTISQTEQYFSSRFLGQTNSTDPHLYIYFLQASFCFKFINYYPKKRLLVSRKENMVGSPLPGADYDGDKRIIIELLGTALRGATDPVLDFITLQMLYLKYPDMPLPEKYPVFKFKVSQNELCRRLSRIREEFDWGQESRKYLAELFSKIPQTENKGVFTYLTYETLHRNINRFRYL